MLLKGLEFLNKLEGFGERTDVKCTGNCEECLIGRVRDAIEAEFDVVEQCHEKGILSDDEYQELIYNYIDCRCPLCHYFGCSCGDSKCEFFRFGAGANTPISELLKSWTPEV